MAEVGEGAEIAEPVEVAVDARGLGRLESASAAGADEELRGQRMLAVRGAC